MGLFDKDKKDKPKADFSKVRSGSSTNAPERATPRPTTGNESATTYTVRSGDTLSEIAKREYGDAGEWRRIFEANRDQIDNPDLIQPGQELRIPGAQGGAR